MSDAPGARASAVLRVRCASEAEARALAAALAPENGDWVAQRVDGATIEARVEADSPQSLLRAADDWLACLSVAEKAARAGT